MENKKYFIEFANNCLGVISKMYEINWTTNKQLTHERSHSIAWQTIDVVDNVMEAYIGLVGKGVINEGDIVPTVYGLTGFADVIADFKEKIVKFKKFLTSQNNPEYDAISSSIDTFISQTLVNIYKEDFE